MKSKDYLKSLAEFLPGEAGSEVRQELKSREEAAARYAKEDAPLLQKPEEELRKLYEVLFMNIVTNELFKQCSEGSTAHQRWKMVEPFTW